MLYSVKIREKEAEVAVKMMLITVLIFSTAAMGYAETSDAVKQNAGIQAERGIKNILFGWTDIPRSIIEVTMNTRNPVWGLAAGTFNGMGKAFPRTVSGIKDIATLPAARCDEQKVRPDKLNTQIR